MSDLFWFSEAEVAVMSPHFPLSRGRGQAYDRRVPSGIAYAQCRGPRWRDAPAEYGPHKTLYNRYVRWARAGVFDAIRADLAGRPGVPGRTTVDATHLKSHRISVSWCH